MRFSGIRLPANVWHVRVVPLSVPLTDLLGGAEAALADVAAFAIAVEAEFLLAEGRELFAVVAVRVRRGDRVERVGLLARGRNVDLCPGRGGRRGRTAGGHRQRSDSQAPRTK